MVLAGGSTPAAPRFDDCGNKPLAAVFDADETLIWNLGAMRYFTERQKDFDPAVWNQWEKTGAGKAVAMPGVIDAIAVMRSAGVTVGAAAVEEEAAAEVERCRGSMGAFCR